MNTTIILSPKLYFSYSQFFISDNDIKFPSCDWSDAHFNQGFARRESAVSFRTLLEFGNANVAVHQCGYKPRNDDERVIAVPFLVTSGTINLEGPETDAPRSFALLPGNYRLTAVQRVTGDDEEAIDLFFERLETLPEKSEIVKMDEALNPNGPLIETAKIASED